MGVLRASKNNPFYLHRRALVAYFLYTFQRLIHFPNLALGQYTDPVLWRQPGDRQAVGMAERKRSGDKIR